MESCRPLAAEQEARAARISASVASVRRALDAQDWTAAREECRSVLALEPAHQLAAALLREANQGIEQEQQRLASIVRQLVDRASEAIERQEFDKADAALKEAETVDADSPAVAQLRQQLTNARAEAEAVLRLHRLSIEEIRRARATFRRGRYDEAVQQLSGFLEVEPAAREAEAEIKRLIALRSAIASSAAASRHQASELVNRAAALAESGDLQEARNFARRALQADPTDAAALTLLDRLLAQQLEERIAAEHARSHAERAEEAEPLLAAALGALERGYVALALQAGLAAQRIAPHRIDAAAFVEEAKSEMTSEDRETRELVAAPFPEPVSAPAPVPAAPAQPESGGVLDKAASLFRGGRRRGKA
jgi:tetratricopeptide (TPR) repeat protein